MKKVLLSVFISVLFLSNTNAQSGMGTCGVFTFYYNIVQPTCPGACNASIEITGLSGGTPSYNYNWSPGIPVGDGTSMIFNLCPGSYSVEFSDAAANTCVVNFIVVDPPPITFTFSTTNVTCNGLCDGTICASGVTGGTPPYSYIWSPVGITTSCITGLCAGTYTLCVTDVNGCTVCNSTVITEPPPLLVMESVVNETCFGCCNGAITLTPNGGTAGYFYTFSPGSSMTGLCSGVYNYCVTDVNGCSNCDSVQVSFPSGISVQTPTLFSVFPNPSSGSFEVFNEGGEAEFKITDVKGKLILTRTFQSGNQKVILSPDIANGIYYIQLNTAENPSGIARKLVIQK